MMSLRTSSRWNSNHIINTIPGIFSAHRKVEPLKCSQVAAAASVSRRRVQACIQSTVWLLSICLQNGENVAVVLKDVGVLFTDGLTFEIKFYYVFIEKLPGKKNFRKPIFFCFRDQLQAGKTALEKETEVKKSEEKGPEKLFF